MSLTVSAVTERKEKLASANQKVMFRVKNLYGLSRESVKFPLNATESIETGQICLTLDPEAEPAMNIGIAEFAKKSLYVRYGAQIVFPGLYELVTSGNYDPTLLNPVRVTATDECTINDEYTGWHALGCLQFMPGSIWAGAEGG